MGELSRKDLKDVKDAKDQKDTGPGFVL